MSISNEQILEYLTKPDTIIEKYNKMLPSDKNKVPFKRDLQEAVKNLSIEFTKKTLTTGGVTLIKGVIAGLSGKPLKSLGTLKGLADINIFEINKLFKKNMKQINIKTDLQLSDDIPFAEIIKKLKESK